MTCIGNSGPLPEPVSEAIEKGGCLAYCINPVIRCEHLEGISLQSFEDLNGHVRVKVALALSILHKLIVLEPSN